MSADAVRLCCRWKIVLTISLKNCHIIWFICWLVLLLLFVVFGVAFSQGMIIKSQVHQVLVTVLRVLIL